MVFIECLLAIIVWRIFSSLQRVDYDEIRNIIKEELKLKNKLKKQRIYKNVRARLRKSKSIKDIKTIFKR